MGHSALCVFPLGWRGAADLARSAARPNVGCGTYPGLRRSPPPLTRGVARFEPGILSARTLRGSEGVNAIRQGEGQGRARGAEGVDTIRRGGEERGRKGAKRGGWGDLSLQLIYEDPYAA